MTIKNAVGRPLKVDAKVMTKLMAAIQTNSNIKDACRYAGISRQTYYFYLNNESVFAEKMETAKINRDKLMMSFLTVW
jgi:ACT domain-containing protein